MERVKHLTLYLNIINNNDIVPSMVPPAFEGRAGKVSKMTTWITSFINKHLNVCLLYYNDEYIKNINTLNFLKHMDNILSHFHASAWVVE